MSFEYRTATLFLPPAWIALTAYSTTAPDKVNVNGFIQTCTTNGTSGTIPPFFFTDGSGRGVGLDNTVLWEFVPAHATSLVYEVGTYAFANSNIYLRDTAGVDSGAPSHSSGSTGGWTFVSTPGAWAEGTAYTADSSYVTSNSNAYRCIGSGLSAATANAPNFTATIFKEKSSTAAPQWTYQAAAQETVTLDTYLCIFDDEILINGVKWRIKRENRFDYTEDKREHEKMVSAGFNRWSGPRKGSMAGGVWAGPRYYYPSRNWNY